jgi:hypothetical protein
LARDLAGSLTDRNGLGSLENLVRWTQPQPIKELKSLLVAAWALIPQMVIDRLCEELQARSQLYLANEGSSISNSLWRISERKAMKGFVEGSHAYTP